MLPERETQLAANFVEAKVAESSHRHNYVVGIFFALGLSFISGFIAYASYRSVQHGTTIFTEVGKVPVIADVRRLISGTNRFIETAKAPRERLNILLLGIGGEGHDGSQLTDTIILASLDLKTQQVGLLSIPRDLAYPLGGGRFEKINSVQAHEEQKYPGEGARRAADVLANLLEVDIHHVVRVDFRGFVNFVDAIGGLEINVERAFIDPQYPTLDDRWTTISFQQGPQTMTGEQALVYVRSRHGSHGEGSDFARGRRQQLVMLAVRDKLLSLRTLTNPTKLSQLYSVASSYIQTDINLWDFLQLAPLLQNFSRDEIRTHVLTDAPDGELVAATVGGAFMLFPKQPDWSDIRRLAQHPFEAGSNPKPQEGASSSSTRVTQKIAPVVLEIKNGTARTGFASQVAAKLERSGYEIVAFGNSLRRGYERTVVYDLTNGLKPAQLSILRRELQADVVALKPSPDPLDAKRLRLVLNDGLAPERLAGSNIDFVVILGEASYALLNTPYATPDHARP